MINVISFIYCDSIEHEDGTKLVRPLQFFAPLTLPSQYSFSASAGLYDLSGLDKITIQHKFLDPDGDLIYDSGVTEIDLSGLELVGGHMGAQLNMELKNVPLGKAGEYSSVLFINGEEKGIFPIEVFARNR